MIKREFTKRFCIYRIVDIDIIDGKVIPYEREDIDMKLIDITTSNNYDTNIIIETYTVDLIKSAILLQIYDIIDKEFTTLIFIKNNF